MTYDEPYETTSCIPSATLPKEARKTLEPNANAKNLTSTQFNLLLGRVQRLERIAESITDQLVKLNIEVYDLKNPIEKDISVGF